MSDGRDVTDAAGRFLAALAVADRPGALRIVEELLDAGVEPVTVLEEIICAAQIEVGRRWQAGQWSVAREHAATAISEAAIGVVTLRVTSPLVGGAGRAAAAPALGHVVVACVEEEWHALPARVVAEVIAVHGWRTTFLGASTPPAQLGSYLHEVAPDAIALSCSLATGLPRARRMIEAVHDAGVRVLAGGPGFGPDASIAVRLGADGWAPTGRGAVALLHQLPEQRRRPLPPLEHEGLDEYADLTVRHAELVEAAYVRLEGRFRPLGSYSERQRAHTREDLGHILDFLSAALFADDSAVFTRFSRWLQELLVARAVPNTALRLSYEAAAEVMAHAPRARKLLLSEARRLPADDT